jgi:hypothetical protein
MMLSGGTKSLAFITLCWTFLVQHASAQDCPNYLQAARADIGKHVATMQRLEHEASDRLKGLDSRPFDFLVGEARKTAAIIADPALQGAGGSKECRDPTQPVRRICADAAQAWVEVLAKYVASLKPDVDKPRFAATVEDCEKLMNLKPLKSVIRGTD